MEAFRAFYVPDRDPSNPEAEEESLYVGAMLKAAEFEFLRDGVKAIKAVEAILRAVHVKR